MRNMIFCLTFFFFWNTAFPSEAALYQCDSSRSAATFTLKHLGIITVSGRFERFAGSFQFDPEKIAASSVEITIQSGSIHSGNNFRDKDLRSPNFFDAENYPLILFKSRGIQNIQRNRFDIEGELTIKGITRKTIFHTELLDSPQASGRLHFHAWAEIRRHDFHLGTSGFNPLLLITNEELQIDLAVQGIPARFDFVAM